MIETNSEIKSFALKYFDSSGICTSTARFILKKKTQVPSKPMTSKQFFISKARQFGITVPNSTTVEIEHNSYDGSKVAFLLTRVELDAIV